LRTHEPNIASELEASPPFFVVDRQMRVVEACPTARRVLGRFALGRCIYDIHPSTRDAYGHLYDRAWATGDAEEVVYHAGNVTMLWMERLPDDLLMVTYKTLARLDTLSLDSLYRSLHRVLDALDATSSQGLGEAPEPLPFPRASGLRLIPQPL
jgi:hypothetical protein